MIEITDISQMHTLTDGNQIIGPLSSLNKSAIRFYGSNNISYIASDCSLENSTIDFKGDNSVIFLSGGNFKHYINIVVHNKNVVFMGRHNHMFKPVIIIAETVMATYPLSSSDSPMPMAVVIDLGSSVTYSVCPR